MIEPNKMADLVGPFHDQSTVAGLLGCPVEVLAERAREGALLAVTTSDGAVVYPAFQFTGSGTFRPELMPVLQSLTGQTGWTVAVWLRTPHPDLNDTSPEAWLTAEGDAETVRVLAGHRAFDLSA